MRVGCAELGVNSAKLFYILKKARLPSDVFFKELAENSSESTFLNNSDIFCHISLLPLSAGGQTRKKVATH